MDRILYNMRFRNDFDDKLLSIITSYGIHTGSYILDDYEYSDVDVATLCDEEIINELDAHLVTVGNDEVVTYISTLDMEQKLFDASQYVFNLLLKGGYALYRKSNYRDSTFLSCYVANNSVLYNLLLMDEVNVFSEWYYATMRLVDHRKDKSLHDKYKRIKFFERHRKDFRKTLRSSTE